MKTFYDDIRFGLRMLLKSPGFSVVALVALALGIGVNTLLFSIINATLIKPLPFQDPDRLVMVWENNYIRGKDRNVVAPANYVAWKERSQAFEDMAAFVPFEGNLTGGGEPERIRVAYSTSNFFEILRSKAELGRPLETPDGTPEAEDATVLSYGFWQRRFGGDPTVVGRIVQLNGRSTRIVGVMGKEFDLPTGVDLWNVFKIGERNREWYGRYLAVVARLKPGVGLDQAQAQMTTLASNREKEVPDKLSGWTINVIPLREQITGDFRPALLTLMAAVAFVLLIGCANVANLLLARATSRDKELALRAALGASRRRLMRQMLTESALLGVLGGACGLALAWIGLKVVPGLIPAEIPAYLKIGLDRQALMFTCALSLLTALIFGSAPALLASRSDPGNSLKEGGRGQVGRRPALSGLLVVAEVTFSLVLLVGAGLLIKSFWTLLGTDAGFNTKNLLTAQINLPGTRYPDGNQQVLFFNELVENVAALPGVESAGAISWLPLGGPGSATSFSLPDRPKPEQGKEPVAAVRMVTPGALEAMQVNLLQGRLFDNRDTADSPTVVVINKSMAEEFWPGDNPVGKRVVMEWNGVENAEVIGVVADVRLTQLDTPARTTIYWALPQLPNNFMTLLIRTAATPAQMTPEIRSVIRRIDAEQPVSLVRDMEEVISGSVKGPRFTVILLVLFAGLAFILAAVGIYGVVSYSVSQRTREIGVRMAFGAGRFDVLAMVLRQNGKYVLSGLFFGVILSFGLTRFLESQLYQVSATDPSAFLAGLAALIVVALAASLIPARRATAVDPMEALRYE